MTKKHEAATIQAVEKKAEGDKKYARLPDKVVADRKSVV